jgi:ribonuclease H2 subunit A
MVRGGVTYNLNVLVHGAITELLGGVVVQVDTVGPPATYLAKLAKKFPNATVTITMKADSLFPIVSTGSVCAYGTRDAALEAFSELENGTGSGLGPVIL